MSLSVDIRHRLGSFELDARFASRRGITALFGPSGSGKTSVIRIIAGLVRPAQGRVALDDDVLVDTEQGIFVPKHRRRFGCVFQEARLFPHMTVRQNLGYGRWFSRQPSGEAPFDRIVDLLGIDTLLARRPTHLSGGEKQRVAIGRALLSSPRMLLMDEPLAALDDARKAEILPYLERLRDETEIPIVYVSHSVAEVARLADSVVVLGGGKVEAIGAAVDILSRPSLSAPGARRESGALLEGTVVAVDAQEGLTTLGFRSVRLLVPGVQHMPGRAVRVHIPARDVMLATVRPEAVSALNILSGRIASMAGSADGMTEVEIDCGGDAVLSRVMTLSARRLALTIGKPVFAIVKTVAFDTL